MPQFIPSVIIKMKQTIKEMHKIKIIKPSAISGYLSNSIHEVTDLELKAIMAYNEIEILESKVVKKAKGK